MDETTLRTNLADSFNRRCPVCHGLFDWRLTNCPEDDAKLTVGSLPAEPIHGKYSVISLLGEGGMGIVFKACQLSTNRPVAVKMLKFDRASLGDFHRFKREGKIIAKLNHPNIVRVFDLDFDDSSEALIVMECLEGVNLSRLIKSQGHLPISDAIDYAIQICNGVEHAHLEKIIHRDLKPSNVMLVEELPETKTAKILDFGIAKTFAGNLRDETLTRTGELFGSPPYMSPEQAQGYPLDFRSDIYSVGCILYEMLTGVPPLTGANALETLMKQIYQVPASLKEASLGRIFPERLEIIVNKTLDKDPSQRYQTIGELRTELQNLERTFSLATERNISKGVPKRIVYLGAAGTIVGLLAGSLLAAPFFAPQPEKPADDSLSKDIKDMRALNKIREKPLGDPEYMEAGDELLDLDVAESKWLGPRLQKSIENNTLANIFSASPTIMSRVAKHKDLTKLSIDDPGSDSCLDYLQNLKLRILHLRRIRITDSGCDKLSRMLTLEELVLHKPRTRPPGSNKNSETDLTKSGLDKLGRLSRIAVLGINKAHFNDNDLSFISKLSELKSLDLSHTGITDGFLVNLKHLHKLTDFDCSFDRISDSGLQALSNIPSLESLNLRQNPSITDEGIKHLTKLRLKNISLESNLITDNSLQQLAKIKSLQEVNYKNCEKVSAKALERLQTDLPLCQVKELDPDVDQ